jgi:biopolymer transport protein TolQ
MLPAVWAPLQAGVRASVPALVMQSGTFNKLLLLLLMGLSIATWAVFLERFRLLRRVSRADRAFRAAFLSSSSLAEVRLLAAQHPNALQAKLALEGLEFLLPRGETPDLSPEVVDLAGRAMERLRGEELDRLERHVGFLATVGSVSPFIGLMGTVWGVMSSFLNIGVQGSASLIVVAPGIAEALIATVAGLAAAIPAVIAFNQITTRLRSMGNDAASFISEFTDRALREARRARRPQAGQASAFEGVAR